MTLDAPTQTAQTPLAIIFTNAGGKVVFANRNFLHLTEASAERAVSGEQLHAILPIESRPMATIIAIITGSGFIDKLPVSVRTANGGTIPVLFSGVAAYSASGDYIGADIFLHRRFIPADPNSPTVPALKHTAVLKTYMAEIFAGTRTQGYTFIQAYVVGQIEVLQVLLARMGGPESRNTLERIINEILRKYAVPASMKSGYLEFHQKSIDISIYRLVLQAAIRYARDSIGQRIVGQEMMKVDNQLDQGLLQLLTQMDMRPTLTLAKP